MLRYKIKMTGYAEQDIEEIGDYIAFQLRNAKAAVNMTKGVRQVIKSLAVNPERHELDSDDMLAKAGVRRYYYKDYKIYYMVYKAECSVVVLRILHTRVDSKAKIYRVFGGDNLSD